MQEIKSIFSEVFAAVMPVAAIVVVLLLLFTSEPWLLIGQFLLGAVLVLTGIGLLLTGVRVGLELFGDCIGCQLPRLGSYALILFFTFLIGFAVTVVEPDVRVLALQVDMVSGEISRNALIMTVSVGVGLFMLIAVARIILGVPIAYILIAGYAVAFVLSGFVPSEFVPVSFDAGGVTAGPLTAPFIIALGVGIASILSREYGMGDCFGLVGLTCIGPILAVMILGVIYG